MNTNATTDITVLVCTYNRREDLRELLRSVLAQETDGAFRYEILVVDNNSNDGTRELIEDLMVAGQDNLRYVFERSQGKSFAMNAGLAVARGTIYQIADDDLLLPPDYLRRVWQAFQTHPDVSVVAGKVLPQWSGAVPRWLTQAHWSALALSDHGATEFYTNAGKPICLLAGAFRRADVEAVGGYHRELGVAPNHIGGTEDVDLLTRMYEVGRKGLYLPELWLRHKVEPERLTKRYHRRWHSGHGRFYALMHAPEIERSTGRLFDVPLHLYRQAAADATAWLSATAGGHAGAAFERETRLHFFAGFFRTRAKEFLAAAISNSATEKEARWKV